MGPPRRLWVRPRGFVGKDQCDSSFHASQCCGYSVPGENCGDRTEDCFCYQWHCGSRRLDAGAPDGTNSTHSSIAAACAVDAAMSMYSCGSLPRLTRWRFLTDGLPMGFQCSRRGRAAWVPLVVGQPRLDCVRVRVHRRVEEM